MEQTTITKPILYTLLWISCIITIRSLGINDYYYSIFDSIVREIFIVIIQFFCILNIAYGSIILQIEWTKRYDKRNYKKYLIGMVQEKELERLSLKQKQQQILEEIKKIEILLDTLPLGQHTNK